MAEEILIKIELEKGDNEKQVDNLTQSINDLQKANANLNKQNKDLIKTGQDNSKQYLENSRQIEINKQKIQQATASRKGLVQAIISEDGAIKALRAENAELIRQRDLITTKTEEGRAKISQLNAKIDENSKVIKENSSEQEKQKINIGNYTSALDGVIPGIGGFTNAIRGGIEAVKAFWIALGPISIALAALALLFAPIVSFLKSTGDGMDLVEKKSTGLKQGFKVLGDQLNELGKSMLDSDSNLAKFARSLFYSNPIVIATISQIKLLNSALNSLTDDGFDKAIAAGEEYAETLDRINTESAFFEANAGQEENAIKRLILQSKNRTISEEERINLIDQALRKEEQLANRRKDLATETLLAEVKLYKDTLGLRQTSEETLVDFANRIARVLDAKRSEEERDKVLNAIKSITDAQAASITIQEKLQNQRDALLDKAEERDAKAAEEAAKRREKALEDARKAREKEMADLIKFNEDVRKANEEQFKTNSEFLATRNQEEINALKQQYIDGAISKQEFEAQLSAIQMQALEERKAFLEANGQETIDIETQITDAKLRNKEREVADQKALDQRKLENERSLNSARLGLFAQFANALKVIGGRNKAIAIAGVLLEKAAALGQIVANTGIANAKAVAASPLTFGQPWVSINTASGVLAGITVAAEAAKSIADINSTKFSLGGTILRGPSHKYGGIPFTVGGRPGFEAEGGEALINKRSTAMFKPLLSVINQAGGGVPFERGGVTYASGSIISGNQTRDAVRIAESQSSLTKSIRTMMEEFPPIVVTVEDINARQSEVQTTVNRAQVIGG